VFFILKIIFTFELLSRKQCLLNLNLNFKREIEQLPFLTLKNIIMLEKIKEVVFISQSYSSNGFDEYEDNDESLESELIEWTDLESDTYIIEHNNEMFIGTFLTTIDTGHCPFNLEGKTIKEVLEFDIKKYGLIDDEGEVIEDFHICFNGCNINCVGHEPYLDCFDIDELNISFIMPYDNNISLSNAMNNDLSQPQRAIGNYLQRELEDSSFKNDPIEFYQNILDVANRELAMHKEGAYTV